MIFPATQKPSGLGWDPLPLSPSLLISVNIQHQSSEFNITTPPPCNNNLYSHREPEEESALILAAASEFFYFKASKNPESNWYWSDS